MPMSCRFSASKSASKGRPSAGVISNSAQGSPGRRMILWTLPHGTGMNPQSVADPKAVRIGADVAACQSHHSHDQQRQNAEQGQSLGQREQRPNLRRQQEPADRGQQAESKRCDDRYHPHSVRSRHVDALVETVVSHWSRH